MNQNKKGDNQFIHETVMGHQCKHTVLPTQNGIARCPLCGLEGDVDDPRDMQKFEAWRVPTYDSPASPRSLLTEAEAKTIEEFGPAAYRDALAYEMFGGFELTASSQTALITAGPDIRCKAIRSIWEGEKE